MAGQALILIVTNPIKLDAILLCTILHASNATDYFTL